MEIANRRAKKIVSKLSDHISQAEELKLDHGVSARSVRRLKWKKDVKARYSTFIADKEKARKVLKQQIRGNWRGNGAKTIGSRARTTARRGAPSVWPSYDDKKSIATYVVGETRCRIRSDAQTAGTGKRRSFNYCEIAQIENNTVQGNAHRLGEVREHVRDASPQQVD